MGIERDTDLNGVRVKPDPDQDDNPATRELTVVGRVQGDNGGTFAVADLGEDGLCALVSDGFIRDNYVVAEDTEDTDSANGDLTAEQQEAQWRENYEREQAEREQREREGQQ